MAVRPLDGKHVVFKHLNGSVVPLQPWPQEFYVSREVLDFMGPQVEIRPLTVVGLLKGVGRNFISMNYWRFLCLLRRAGFLTTKEGEAFNWNKFTFQFWEYSNFRRKH